MFGPNFSVGAPAQLLPPCNIDICFAIVPSCCFLLMLPLCLVMPAPFGGVDGDVYAMTKRRNKSFQLRLVQKPAVNEGIFFTLKYDLIAKKHFQMKLNAFQSFKSSIGVIEIEQP